MALSCAFSPLKWPPQWQYSLGKPTGTARFKSQCSDFYVYEHLGFSPSGAGEHVFLDITKTNTNTEFLARQIARLAQVPKRQVAYSGMKDRHGITRQWFSVHLPGGRTNQLSEPEWRLLNSADVQLHQAIRHQKKLRLGVHQHNDFVILLRDVAPSEGLEKRLQSIKRHGVPNYFGEQRFGHHGNNLNLAQAYFFQQQSLDRFKRGLVISATRAYLFNTMLSQQVADGSWLKASAHEYYGFSDGYSQFAAGMDDEEALQQRIDDGHISPLGWIAGAFVPSGKAQSKVPSKQEQQALLNYNPWIAALGQKNMVADRRALRLLPLDFQWQWLPESVLELRFGLLRGHYATSLVRELVGYVATL